MLNKQLILLITILTLFSNINAKYTNPILYQPFSHAPLQRTLIINETIAGECFKQSVTNERKDAWYCSANGTIYDPCFKHPFDNKNELVCPYSPWHNSSIKIVTKQLLDNSSHIKLDMSKSKPWALELMDGTRCLVISPEQGAPYKYQCENNKNLSGKLYRCQGIWQIYQHDNDTFNKANVKRAWF